MPCDHSYSVLYDHGGFGVGDYRCTARASGPGAEEQSGEHAIVFLRRGAFEKHVGKRRTLATPNTAVFFRGGEVHRTGHPASGGDDCTVFLPDRSTLLDMLAVTDPGARERSNPFPADSVTLEPGLFLRHWRVFNRLEMGRVDDTVAIQEELLDVCSAVLGAVARESERPRPDSATTRAATRREHRALAHDTAALLAARFTEALTLAQIADEVCSSQFHLSRVFKRELGLPIHRYLSRLRLRSAVECLAAGHSNLTLLALELGFSSRGHLSDAFRAEYGVAPSVLRRELAIN